MTEGRRIFLNIVATYGRSLYALIIGLFCGRWALIALGQVDYGLIGLVGGLTAFVSFVNGLLSMSVARFYAVSVGAARKNEDGQEGLDACWKWFNTALLIHTLVPVFFMIVGYPVGEWAVRHFLTIPPDRIDSCVWVWRFTSLTCFVGMITVPFNAMYTAKQEIAELTIYGFATSTLNVLMLAYMITHPGIWIVKYALWGMFLSVTPQIIIVMRAVAKYRECRFVCKYLYDRSRIHEIAKFAFARFWTALSSIVSAQGNSILVNKYLGPSFNASMTIGNTVASNADTLSSALSGAFWPAIANKAGEGDEDGVKDMSFKTCKFGAALILLFAIPLALEIDEVLRLWLKTPPDFVAIICLAILIDLIFDRMSEGYWMAIMGLGRGVGTYSAWISITGFSRFLMAWAFFAAGYGIFGLCLSIILSRVVALATRLVLGWKLVEMSARRWVVSVFMPMMSVGIIAIVFGALPRLVLKEASLGRVCLTTIMCEVVFVPACWMFLLTAGERQFLAQKIKTRYNRYFPR